MYKKYVNYVNSSIENIGHVYYNISVYKHYLGDPEDNSRQLQASLLKPFEQEVGYFLNFDVK